jgi:hypothetical protein
VFSNGFEERVMTTEEKEKKFNYVIEIGLCAVLIILYSLELIPIALCIVLCLASFAATIVINEWWSEQ